MHLFMKPLTFLGSISVNMNQHIRGEVWAFALEEILLFDVSFLWFFSLESVSSIYTIFKSVWCHWTIVFVLVIWNQGEKWIPHNLDWLTRIEMSCDSQYIFYYAQLGSWAWAGLSIAVFSIIIIIYLTCFRFIPMLKYKKTNQFNWRHSQRINTTDARRLDMYTYLVNS